MEFRRLAVYLPLAIVLCVPRAFGQESADDAGVRHRLIPPKAFPHHWRRLYPVHKQIKLTRRNTVNTTFLGQGQPAGSQPIAQNLPLWDYSIVAGQDGNTYQGSMLGRNPYYNGHRSTTVQAYLVPVVLTFPDGSVYDPTAYDACLGDNVMDLVENSPVFQTIDFTFTDSNGNNPVDVGTTQYPDAYQRANYWQYVAPNANTRLPYHTLTSVTTVSAVNVTVPSGYGFSQGTTCPNGNTTAFAEMDYNWWDSYVTSNLIPSLGISSSSVPIFIFDSVVMYLNGDSTQCCALGDHGAYFTSSNALQTYIVSNYDDTGQFDPDICVLSDEVSKWIDDPLDSNPTPSWPWPNGANIGQPCETLLEVGDPLAGYVFQVAMPNGVTYNPQEIVFFSWFYDQVPSIGAGGWYSDQGTLTSDAGPVCQSQ